MTVVERVRASVAPLLADLGLEIYDIERAVGQVVNLRTHPEAEGDRRARGELLAVDTDGITVRLEDGTERTIRFEDIERARTVFEWGPGASPAPPRPKRKAHSS